MRSQHLKVDVSWVEEMYDMYLFYEVITEQHCIYHWGSEFYWENPLSFDGNPDW